MSFDLYDFLELKEISSEERELIKISDLNKDLYNYIDELKIGFQENFFDELISKISSLIHNYVQNQENSICPPIQKYLYLIYDLYHNLLDVTFLNEKFFMCFLFKRIFLFYDSIHQDYSNINIFNDSILNLCKEKINPIFIHCLNLIVNKFIFESNLTDFSYFLKYFQENFCSNVEISLIKIKIAEIFFVQLICLDDFKNNLINFNDENTTKDFIENQIINYYNINKILEEQSKKRDDNNIYIDDNSEYKDKPLIFLFENNFNKSQIHLLRYLHNAIINVFTPIDANILDYFQTYVDNYFSQNYIRKNNNINKKNINDLKLDYLGELLLNSNIQDVDIKIRNLSFLLDIIIQKYFNIQKVPELDLLKFPRLNIIINRLFMEKVPFHEGDKKEIVNGIFEHFIISQFMYNYIKFQMKDPEHYPIEIRYFIIYSYIKISEQFLINNPFSAYITSVSLKEMINCLHFERGFKKQKYMKNSYIDNNNVNNNQELFVKKNSTKKTKRRRSVSKSKKKKKKGKKKSVQKTDVSKSKNNIDINLLESYIKLENETINESKKSDEKLIFGEDDILDDPERIISKVLFNYLCFIYSMKTKYSEYSKYFEELYLFIDYYISQKIKNINLDDNWTWLLIYQINYIPNFKLTKTFEKFKLENNINLDTKVKLIAYLSKKVKYCNTQEHYLILDVIYNILINIDDLNSNIKSQKYCENFRKLNRALSYLSFNINYSMNLPKNMSLIDQEFVGDKLFKIINLLFIESIDEYFWMPKSLKGYKSFNDFVCILDKSFNKILYKQSLYSEPFLYGVIQLKRYINKFVSKNNMTKKEKEKEQYLISLDYFCKLEFPNLNKIQDLKNVTIIKEYIYKLLELMPNEYDLEYDLNEKCQLLFSILLSGENDLIICLFLIFQLLTNRILKDNSEEIKLITEIFDLMINKKYKFMINFLLTLYKSIEKYLLDLIDNYVEINLIRNSNFKKSDYFEYKDLFNINKPVEKNNLEGKEIQIIYNNWTLVKKNLEETDVFFKFLVEAEEINYPKSVMNLIEKYIFDFTRKKNIHNFTFENCGNKIDNNDKKKILKYLKLYYKAYSHIDDNKVILDNYFNEKQLLLLLFGKNNISNSNYENCLDTSSNSNNISENFTNFINNIQEYLIDLNTNILFDNMLLIGNVENKKNCNNIYFTVCRLLYNIVILHTENIDIKNRIIIYSKLEEIKKHSILKVLSDNNKFNESNNSINFSLFLYEFILYFEQFELLFNKGNNGKFVDKKLLAENLKNILFNKRKIPHLKRYLLIFQFRRFIFNLLNDHISELYCLMDICKIYKSIYETDISINNYNSFLKYIKIYLDKLLILDDNLLLNSDKKLFLVPLKYFTKFFVLDNFEQYDSVFSKYKNLCLKNQDLFSYKILILLEKMKYKRGVVGLNNALLNKIKKLGKKSSPNNKEGYLLYEDFYLDILLKKENVFNKLKPNKDINNIRIYDINQEIFEYLEGAINICIITDKEKYLRKYMPEIINLFFKLNFAVSNYNQDNNLYNNSQSQTQSLIDEKINKFIYLLNKFKNDENINKVKIIIPQLMICYQYEKTYLYNFSIELLILYAEKNIHLIAYLLSSFLNFKIEDLKSIGLRQSKNDLYNNKYKNYSNTFLKSKNFVSIIKHKLSEKNKKILLGYEEFCLKLINLFFECKKFTKETFIRLDKLANDINNTLSRNKIILPIIENIRNYEYFNGITSDILFLKELDSKIEILSSKEKPIHIKFKINNIEDSLNTNKYYEFLLKCDVNDITKEIKTFEIIDEINNIFRIKHYDIHDSMSLKRYLIVPIAPTIILAEWLSNSISLSSIIEEQCFKDLIYLEENKSIIQYETSSRVNIKPGVLVNQDEKFNILYNYYQYNFFDPNLWYNAKKKFIISTAIWSMTSFIVGLGDRHPGNIMINIKNGEIIHIDFGYVALKGLSLQVPEIVDFRFTINLRKNLGLFEENGLFNYICIKTLKTFKEYYKTLSSRIEYYQFDPLFDRDNDNQTFNLYIQNDNFFNVLDENNVKDRLKELIIKNKNGENLEKMYVWWSPWI